MFTRIISVALGLSICAFPARAQERPVAERVDAYLQPYVQSGNFSGAVLAKLNGKTVFEKAYGFADRERKVPNTVETRFRVASVSMQFTAAAVLRLVDEGKVSLDTRVGEFIPGMTKESDLSEALYA